MQRKRLDSPDPEPVVETKEVKKRPVGRPKKLRGDDTKAVEVAGASNTSQALTRSKKDAENVTGKDQSQDSFTMEKSSPQTPQTSNLEGKSPAERLHLINKHCITDLKKGPVATSTPQTMASIPQVMKMQIKSPDGQVKEVLVKGSPSKTMNIVKMVQNTQTAVVQTRGATQAAGQTPQTQNAVVAQMPKTPQASGSRQQQSLLKQTQVRKALEQHKKLSFEASPANKATVEKPDEQERAVCARVFASAEKMKLLKVSSLGCCKLDVR